VSPSSPVPAVLSLKHEYHQWLSARCLKRDYRYCRLRVVRGGATLAVSQTGDGHRLRRLGRTRRRGAFDEATDIDVVGLRHSIQHTSKAIVHYAGVDADFLRDIAYGMMLEYVPLVEFHIPSESTGERYRDEGSFEMSWTIDKNVDSCLARTRQFVAEIESLCPSTDERRPTLTSIASTTSPGFTRKRSCPRSTPT